MKSPTTRFILLTILPVLLILAMYSYDLKSYAVMQFPFVRNLVKNDQPHLTATYSFDNNKVLRILGVQDGLVFMVLKNRSELIVLDRQHNKYEKIYTGKEKFTNSFLYNDRILLQFPEKYVTISWRDHLKIDSFSARPNPGSQKICVGENRLIERIPVNASFSQYRFAQSDWQGKVVKVDAAISEQIEDGGLSTDGFLSRSGDRLFYVYHYGNTILCFDTSLVLRYKALTVDKMSDHLPRIIKDTANKSYSFGETRRINHLLGFANEKYLFIHSVVKSSTDLYSVFKNSLTFDKYDVGTGQYAGSFYIPNVNMNEVRSAYSKDQQLYLLLDKKLLLYDLPSTL